jgi:hypothetical protein
MQDSEGWYRRSDVACYLVESSMILMWISSLASRRTVTASCALSVAAGFQAWSATMAGSVSLKEVT